MSTTKIDSSDAQQVAVAGATFRVSANDRGPFWHRVSAGHWEPQSFAILDHFLRSGPSYVDIGAWIGPTALFAATRSPEVHAFEPDPVAFAELTANVALNPGLERRIQLDDRCIASVEGARRLYVGGMYLGSDSHLGDSMSGLLPTAGAAGQPSHEVTGVVLPDYFEAQGLARCGLIKMDVEGGEYMLIAGRWRTMAAFGMPPLYVSLHAPEAAKRESLIGGLLEELRGCYRHLYVGETGRPLELPRLIDWTDDSDGSPWRLLESLLGGGLVACNEEWQPAG